MHKPKGILRAVLPGRVREAMLQEETPSMLKAMLALLPEEETPSRLIKAMPLSEEERPSRLKAMPLSEEERPSKLKAMVPEQMLSKPQAMLSE
jgi:hypothetical protein